MIDSTTMTLLITCFACGICILCMYSVYANVIRHETTLHELRNRVEFLQNQQTLRLAELKGEIPAMDVEIPGDEPATPVTAESSITQSQATPNPATSPSTQPAGEAKATSSSTKAA